jgi:hypothetical protein
MHDAAAFMREHEEYNKTRPVTVGTVKKSIDAAASTWFVRNVLHVCDGGRGRVNRRETVRSEMAMPSVRSSPWILGAPHKGFPAAMSRTRSRVFESIAGGRPTCPDRDRCLHRR